MGFARTFSIREASIRDYVRRHGRDDRLACAVGEQVLAMTEPGAFDRVRPAGSLPLFEAAEVFVPARSYHSTDFAAVLWTGRRMVDLGEPDKNTFRLLRRLQQQVDPANWVLSLSDDERDLAIARREWKSPLEADMAHSLWWIYEDFTRDYTRDSRDKWPSQEVGSAVLDLMFSNWSRDQAIRNHGNAISRVASQQIPELAIILWWRNCLRLMSQFEPDELDRLENAIGENEQANTNDSQPSAGH